MTVVLEGASCRAEIRPELGGRVQHLVDLASGRELLYQRDPTGPPDTGFLEASTGGWDEMFPNDEPWNGHPDHGRVWSAEFDLLEKGSETCILAVEIEQPRVRVERRYRLLDTPRRGLRSELAITARRDTGTFLWASHPMLSVEPGWRVGGLDDVRLEVDDVLTGRFVAGALPDSARPVALTVPDAGMGIVEVVYANGVRAAQVVSPDGSSRTSLQWDAELLPWLWICTVSGEVGIDLCMLLEPCTSFPYRVADAIRIGTAARLSAGESAEWWVEMESLDA